MAAKVSVQHLFEPCSLMEGPHWDHQKKRLYFVDILASKIFCYHTETKQLYNAYIDNGTVGVIVPVQGETNKFVVGSGRDLLLLTWDGESNVPNLPFEKIASVESNKTNTRFNDGKVDSAGRLWIGTMAIEKDEQIEPNCGSLYCIGSDLQPKLQVSPVSISNGLDWSLQNDIMYYNDSFSYQIWAYDFDAANGTIKNKRVVFDLKKNNVEGIPDGMTMDSTGNLWLAVFSGSKVLNIDPKQGKLLRSIDIPAKNVTSVAFGGPNLNILYVTTARINMTNEEKMAQKHAGCLFAIEGLGVKGRLPHSFNMRK